MLYFAYGSNLHKFQMKQRCPDSLPVSPCKLNGYALVFRGVADIIPAPKKTVIGAIYDVSGQDKVFLDRYEGFPSLYTRKTVEVTLPDGWKEEAFVYIMRKGSPGLPGDGYYNIIREGYEHWGLPLKSLKHAIKTTEKLRETWKNQLFWVPQNLNAKGGI